MSRDLWSASRLECPFCEGPLDPANVDIDRKVGKCATCETLFSFGGLVVDQQGIGVFPGAYAEKLPPGLWIEDRETAGQITEAWLAPVYVFIAIISVFTDI